MRKLKIEIGRPHPEDNGLGDLDAIVQKIEIEIPENGYVWVDTGLLEKDGTLLASSELEWNN